MMDTHQVIQDYCEAAHAAGMEEEEIIPVEASLLEGSPQQANVIVATCKNCGQPFTETRHRSPANRDYCVDCAAPQHRKDRALVKDNSHWMQEALEQGIPPWEQQPGETVDEYTIWEAYRALWPNVRPTVTRVAKDLGLSVGAVQKVATRWTWPARLQSWIREVNADKTAALRAAKRKMVEDHISLGEKMRAKMEAAVDALDPEDVTPNELVSLLKETQRLEQTAREALDAVEQETSQDIDNIPNGLFASGDDSAAAPGENSKGLSVDDMAEVVGILAQAGVLQVNGTKVGVRQTTTTEVVATTDEL